MTGTTITRNVDNSYLYIGSGTDSSKGAHLFLGGNGRTTEDAGQFSLTAIDNSNTYHLMGKPDGSLTWGGKSIDVIEEQGDGYIRYSNGLQICWGLDYYSNGQVVSYAKVFCECPSVIVSGWIIAEFWDISHFTMSIGNGSYAYASWQAIGRWK